VFDELSKNKTLLLDTDFGKREPAASYLSNISDCLLLYPQIYFPEQYLYGFAVDSWQLRRVLDAVQENPRVHSEEWTEALGDVAHDVCAKISFAERFLPPPKTLGPEPKYEPEIFEEGVNVIAATRDKDGKEVSSYEVWFCLKGLINYKDRYDHFDRLSSPTDCEMPPGNYVFWTRKGSDQGAMVTVSDVGADGKMIRQIDLPTP
jgi:hypothetical protein